MILFYIVKNNKKIKPFSIAIQQYKYKLNFYLVFSEKSCENVYVSFL